MVRKIAWRLTLAFFAGCVGILILAMNDRAKAVEDPFGEQGGEKPAAAAQKDKPVIDIKLDIQQALEDPTTMDFNEMAFSDVIEYLRDLHKVKHPGFEIKLDMKPLNEVGITAETPITLQLKGQTLRSALKLMLRDLSLTYIIRDEVLLITTPEEACYTKVYDVADIVSAKEGEASTALESLMKMVAKTCPPSPAPGMSGWPGWVESLKSAKITVIVVNEPEEFQEKVAELLAQLRDVKHTK